MKKYLIIPILLLGCKNEDNSKTATGIFEAQETMVSGENAGKIVKLALAEGQEIKAGQVVGMIDPEAFLQQKSQLESSLLALEAKRADAAPQLINIQAQAEVQNENIKTIQEQVEVLKKEKARFEMLVKTEAAPSKQLDDVSGQLAIAQQQLRTAEAQARGLSQQMKAAKDAVAIQNRAILSEKGPLHAKMRQLDDQIAKTAITNPVTGTVTTQYLYANEWTMPGKPIYKIADLSQLNLRIYVTGQQLKNLKIGQDVSVVTDPGGSHVKGKLVWISSKAEFTPKTIQTADERVNLVYAAKIVVQNPGNLKVGMYADVQL